MRVLFHCCEFPPHAGGVGTYLQHMSEALSMLGHEVVVVTSRQPNLPEKEISNFGTIYRMYDLNEIRSRKVCDLVLQVALDHNVDLIEGADHLGEMSRIIKARRRPPILVKVHGSNPIKVVRDSQVLHSWQRAMIELAHLRNLGQYKSELFSLEHADLMAVPSYRLLEEMRKQGLKLPSQIGVIPNSIMPCDDLNISENSNPTILFPARIEIRKGLQYLPDLIRRLATRLPSVRLVIAGNDSYARGLGSLRNWLINQLGPEISRVDFTGKLNQQDMDRAYRNAWVVILPTRWDNCPMVILEAMVRSKAIVTSPHGGMPEMLHGTSCRVEEPGTDSFADAVFYFLSDAYARREAGASARRKAIADFGPLKLAQDYVDFIERAGIGVN